MVTSILDVGLNKEKMGTLNVSITLLVVPGALLALSCAPQEKTNNVDETVHEKRIVKQESYNSTGTFENYWIYHYSKSNALEKIENYSSSNSLMYRDLYDVGTTRGRVKFQTYDSTGKLLGINKYS